MFIQDKKIFTECGEPLLHEKLPSGIYKPSLTQSGAFFFEQLTFNGDEILELPQVEYKKIVQELDHFLKPETKAKFVAHNYNYKRSTLMHSAPGMGKSCIVMRTAQSMLAKGGIVLFVEDPRALVEAYKVLPTQTLKLVIFEEFDNIIDMYGEGTLLTLLDGETQQENVIYMSTTNHIENIPPRFLRPGRHSSVIEIKTPGKAAREFYINKKAPELSYLAAETEGLTIDELSEVIKSVCCLGQNAGDVIARLKSLPRFEEDDEEDYEPDPYYKLSSRGELNSRRKNGTQL